jgi:hypothetical protein
MLLPQISPCIMKERPRHQKRGGVQRRLRYAAAAPRASGVVCPASMSDVGNSLPSDTWVNGRNGTLLVTHGKTKAARRMLPMTPRVRLLLESRWKTA